MGACTDWAAFTSANFQSYASLVPLVTESLKNSSNRNALYSPCKKSLLNLFDFGLREKADFSIMDGNI